MPIILLAFIAIIMFVLCCAAVIEEDMPGIVRTFILVLTTLLYSWLGYATFNVLKNPTEQQYTVKIYDDQAIIVLDDKPVNANKKFNRNFTDGQQISVLKYKEWCAGIWYMEPFYRYNGAKNAD